MAFLILLNSREIWKIMYANLFVALNETKTGIKTLITAQVDENESKIADSATNAMGVSGS